METQKTYNIVKLMGRQNKHKDYSAINKKEFMYQIELFIKCLQEIMVSANYCAENKMTKLERMYGKQLVNGLRKLVPFDDEIHQIFIIEQRNGWGDLLNPLMNKEQRAFYIQKYKNRKCL